MDRVSRHSGYECVIGWTSEPTPPLLGGWAPRTDGYVVDTPWLVSPLSRVVGPLPNGQNGFLNGGY